MEAKEEKGVEILVAGKTHPNPHDQGSNERNQKELEKDEPRTKESDNDPFHRKRKDETR